jgi:rhamnosyltransferase
MLVSVIVPIKNGGVILKKVLKKILDQKVNFNFELILVDSGSSDGSYEYIKKLKKKYSIINVYQIKSEEFGHGKTRNYATTLASGEFFVFLTQDALPINNLWLQNLINGFHDDEEIGGVFGKHLPYDDALPVEKYTIVNHFDIYIGDSWQKVKIEDKEHFNNNMGWYIFFSNNNSCIRKNVFDKIRFSEVEMSEDQNFAKKMLLKGYAKAYVNDSIVYHSHRYSAKEIFKRFYDEYRSYNHLGVEKEASLFGCFKFYLQQVTNSIFFIRHTVKGKFNKIRWVFFYFYYDLAKALGYYFGTNTHKFKFYNLFSMQEENKRK